MPDPAIRISNLSKAYRIQRDDTPRATNAGEALTRWLRNPLKRIPSETFWALKDIDLEIERGEVVGVIGRNGAGKSTLLKVLSRITEPTTGRIELFGRVGSLLEVGTGFHPELTGRENIFLNGAILGMKRSEIKKQFDEIVDFAGVEKFLDTPVKRYSSGMYVRLAFAVAAHLNPEILIVDEVLAVGDAEFQKKCLGKMQDVANSGRTVLFVSHNISAITSLCSLGVWLDRGGLARVGVPRDLLAEYTLESASNQATAVFESPDSPIAFACIESPSGAQISSHVAGDDLRIRLELNVPPGHSSPEVGVGITASDGVRVCTAASSFQSRAVDLPRSGEVSCVIKSLSLTEGRYSIRLGLDCSGVPPFRREDALCFEVVSRKDRGCRSQLRVHGVVETDSCWQILSLSET